MPAYVSPGVYVIEKDWSDYSPSLNSTSVGILGFASQGPVGLATLVTNADQLVSRFGRPDDAEGGFGLIGAYHILDRTNTVYFTRTATTNAAVAEVGVKVGNCPHAGATALTTDDNYLFIVSVKDGIGGNRTTTPLVFNCPAASSNASLVGGADAIMNQVNIRTTPNSPVSFNRLSSATGDFVGSFAGSGAEVEVYGWSSVNTFGIIPPGTTGGVGGTISSLSATNAVLSGVSGNMTLVANNGYADLTAAQGITSSGTEFVLKDLSGGGYVTRSLYPGAGYNFSSTVETYGIKNTGLQDLTRSNQGARSQFSILRGGGTEQGVEVECVYNATGIDLSPSAILNNTADESNKTSDLMIGEFAVDLSSRDDVLWTLPTSWGEGFGGSNLAVWTASGGLAYTVSAGADLKYGKLVDGTYDYSGGINGDLSAGMSFADPDVKAAVIGDAAQSNGIYSFLKEDIDVSILAIPGCTEQNIVNNAISIAADSQEFLFVTNPPLGVTSPQNAIAWSNGTAEGRTAALNSSYACVYWPWVKLFNTFTQVDEYVSPDIFAIRQMAFTDNNFDAWFAPAGLVRGRLTKPVDVEMVLTQGDRDALYGPGNVINPVQKFATEGIVLWGQRTTQRTATALDRINVRRLMIVIRKMLIASTRQFVFEPNDAATWKRIVNAVEPMMADIKSRRGVIDFKVICDGTTNTPLRIDRSELWCKVILQPTKAAEVIVFELNLTSATLGLNLPS
tara:strand:+ start:382 stop:2580 length:2199 start_codon:yes stop_codon:yes gene_type:complete